MTSGNANQNDIRLETKNPSKSNGHYKKQSGEPAGPGRSDENDNRTRMTRMKRRFALIFFEKIRLYPRCISVICVLLFLKKSAFIRAVSASSAFYHFEKIRLYPRRISVIRVLLF